jgi:hypothetical protein
MSVGLFVLFMLTIQWSPRNCFPQWLSALSFSGTSTSAQPYEWREKEKYYYPTVQQKSVDIVNGNCTYTLMRGDPDRIKFNNALNSDLLIYEFPIDNELLTLWQSMQSPVQMRIDPLLCDIVYTKKNPIFNNTGCQLPDYMSGSAPRCQTSYLKWICQQSKLDIHSQLGNNFALPESAHSSTEIPPTPYLVVANDSYVTLCGQIVSRCGMVHTTANCKSKGYKSQGILFQKKCNMDIKSKVFVDLVSLLGLNFLDCTRCSMSPAQR